eukprot:Skav213011  [mRNA]  locus=scaffold2312:118508:122454:+ [translate_table: standard]
MGHGRSIDVSLKVLEVQEVYGVRLIRLRNPWGKDAWTEEEWTGRWSRGYPASAEGRAADGSFWHRGVELRCYREGWWMDDGGGGDGGDLHSVADRRPSYDARAQSLALRRRGIRHVAHLRALRAAGAELLVTGMELMKGGCLVNI